METIPTSKRTRVRRVPDRGRYDRETIGAILDEGLVCHVGFAVDGQPYVIPTIYGRVDDQLFIHGSTASRMVRSLREGVPVCVTVTLLDGLILARSAFHHSMNYRSVVVLGNAVEVSDPDARLAALEAIVNHVVPGRWPEVRWPNEQELRATSVLRLPLGEASAKVRTGPPLDLEDDLGLNCWAGEIPLRLVTQEPVPDPQLAPGIEPSETVTAYRRPCRDKR